MLVYQLFNVDAYNRLLFWPEYSPQEYIPAAFCSTGENYIKKQHILSS